MEKTDFRIQKTYQALHQAFTQLLNEKQFDQLTVHELCDRAMIRRATFYKHFGDKYEYFSFYMREESAAFFQAYLRNDAPSATDPLLQLTQTLLDFLTSHEKLVQNVKNSRVFPMLLSMVLEQFQSDVETLLRSADMDAQGPAHDPAMAAFYTGGMANLFFYLLQTQPALDEERYLSIVKQFIPLLLPSPSNP